MGSEPALVAESLRNTIRDHVTAKATQAQQAGASVFLLLYARTFGAGMGDLRRDRFAEVMESLLPDAQNGLIHGGEYWGGAVLFDWSEHSHPDRRFALIASAPWPPQSSAESFRQVLS